MNERKEKKKRIRSGMDLRNRYMIDIQFKMYVLHALSEKERKRERVRKRERGGLRCEHKFSRWIWNSIIDMNSRFLHFFLPGGLNPDRCNGMTIFLRFCNPISFFLSRIVMGETYIWPLIFFPLPPIATDG